MEEKYPGFGDKFGERFGEHEEAFDIRKLLGILLRRWKIIFAVFLTVVVVSSSVVLIREKNKVPTYTSRARIMITPDKSDAATMLESDIIGQRASAALSDRFEYKDSKQKLYGEVRYGLKIKANKDKTIEIFATTDSGQKSFDVVSSVVESYRKQQEDDEQAAFQDNYRTLSARVETARKNFLRSQDQLSEFMAKNKQLLDRMKKYGITEEQSQNFISVALNDAYFEVKNKALAAQRLFDTVRELINTDKLAAYNLLSAHLGTASDTGTRSAPKGPPGPYGYSPSGGPEYHKHHAQQYDAAKKTWDSKRSFSHDTYLAQREKLNSLLNINEEAHPDVIAAKRELEDMEKALDTEIIAGIKNLKKELDTMRIEEKDLSDIMSSDFKEKLMAYNSLIKDIDLRRRLFEKDSEAFQKFNLEEKDKAPLEIKVLEPPSIPDVYSNAFPFQRILLGVFLGLFLGLITAYMLDMLDQTVKDADQLRKLVNTPILATVPFYRKIKLEEEKK